jgi:hypothetical protein
MALAAALWAMGLATLPQQLGVLHRALAPTGEPLQDAHTALLRDGIVRVIVVDRLVPSPTLLVAGLLLVLAAEPVLMLARERRGALHAVVLMGLAPLIVQRLGELAIVYLGAPEAALAGDAVTAPHRFSTGPSLLWRHGVPAPGWLEVLNDRLNLLVLWCVALWALGMRMLDGGPLRPWHVALPAACVAGAGVITWALGPLALSAVLRLG